MAKISPLKYRRAAPWYLQDWDTLTVSPSWTSSIAGDQARWYWYDFYSLIFSCFCLHFRSYAKIPKTVALAESWNYCLECWEIDYWSIFVGNSLGDSFVCFCIIRSSSINKIFTLLKKKRDLWNFIMEELFSRKRVFGCRQNNDKLMGFWFLFSFSFTVWNIFWATKQGTRKFVCNFSVFEIWVF